MRDSLALALVRAEFCRAYAAERARPKDKTGNVRLPRLAVRLWRWLRRAHPARVSTPPSD